MGANILVITLRERMNFNESQLNNFHLKMTVGTSFRLAAASAAFATLALYLLQKRPLKKAVRNKYPPGPKPLPLVGNVKDFPTSFEWETFAEWAKQYGKPDSVERVEATGSYLL